MVIAAVVVEGPATPGLSPESCYLTIPVASSADERGTLRNPRQLPKRGSSIYINRLTAAAKSNRQTFVGELATTVTEMDSYGIVVGHTIDAFRATCHT